MVIHMTPNWLKTFTNLPEAKQQSILQVALEEFSENGYERTSINTIVKRLGIAKGSIFQYFNDKKGLFVFVFEASLQNVKSYLKAVRDDTSCQDFYARLEQILKAGVRFIDAHPLIYRLYLRVLFESQMPFRQEILLTVRRYSHDFLREIIEAARERGEIRADLDVDITAFTLDALLDRFLQAQCVEHLDGGLGLHGIREPETDRWVAALVDLVRSGTEGTGLTRPADRRGLTTNG